MKTLLLLALSSCGLAVAPSRAADVAKPPSFHRILILGDSITHHAPDPSLGWAGDWGMAASSANNDYVHLFLAKLAKAAGPTAAKPDVLIFGEGGGKITDKLPFISKITAFHADLALVQLGENDNKDVTVAGFQQPYEQLLAAIQAGNPSARVLCVGVWGIWPTGDQTKDVMIRAACQKYGAAYADLGGAYANAANRAGADHRFTNAGVNWHPGDAGMVAYADAFWKALSNPASAAPGSSPEAGIRIDETWGVPPSLPWSPAPPLAQEDGRPMAQLSSATPRRLMFTTPLDVSKVSGRLVEIRTRIQGDSISEKPKVWNGVKLMMRIQNAEGKLDWPQFKLPDGTFPWIDVDWTVRIPDNAVSVDLSIGLEDVSGTATYDAIHITARSGS